MDNKIAQAIEKYVATGGDFPKSETNRAIVAILAERRGDATVDAIRDAVEFARRKRIFWAE